MNAHARFGDLIAPAEQIPSGGRLGFPAGDELLVQGNSPVCQIRDAVNLPESAAVVGERCAEFGKALLKVSVMGLARRQFPSIPARQVGQHRFLDDGQVPVQLGDDFHDVQGVSSRVGGSLEVRAGSKIDNQDRDKQYQRQPESQGDFAGGREIPDPHFGPSSSSAYAVGKWRARRPTPQLARTFHSHVATAGKDMGRRRERTQNIRSAVRAIDKVSLKDSPAARWRGKKGSCFAREVLHNRYDGNLLLSSIAYVSALNSPAEKAEGHSRR